MAPEAPPRRREGRGGAGRDQPPGEPRRPTNCCWQLGRNPELRPPLRRGNQTRSRKWLLPGETTKQSLRGHDSRSDSGAGEATVRGDLVLHYRKQVLLSNPLHSPGGPRVPEPTRRAGFAQHSCRKWLLSGQPANRPSSRRGARTSQSAGLGPDTPLKEMGGREISRPGVGGVVGTRRRRAPQQPPQGTCESQEHFRRLQSSLPETPPAASGLRRFGEAVLARSWCLFPLLGFSARRRLGKCPYSFVQADSDISRVTRAAASAATSSHPANRPADHQPTNSY